MTATIRPLPEVAALAFHDLQPLAISLATTIATATPGDADASWDDPEEWQLAAAALAHVVVRLLGPQLPPTAADATCHLASIAHDVESYSRGGSSRMAWCTCGWRGPERGTLTLATDDAIEHEREFNAIPAVSQQATATGTGAPRSGGPPAPRPPKTTLVFHVLWRDGDDGDPRAKRSVEVGGLLPGDRMVIGSRRLPMLSDSVPFLRLDHPSVGPIHAAITVDDRGVWVTGVAPWATGVAPARRGPGTVSGRPLAVNGVLISGDHRLENGDTFGVGVFDLTISIETSPSVHETATSDIDDLLRWWRAAEDALQRCWSKAVGTPDYVKDDWMLLQNGLASLTRDIAERFGYHGPLTRRTS